MKGHGTGNDFVNSLSGGGGDDSIFGGAGGARDPTQTGRDTQRRVARRRLSVVADALESFTDTDTANATEEFLKMFIVSLVSGGMMMRNAIGSSTWRYA